eukprot:1817723-Alexandrium_andersonii.AAC.1
MVESRSSSFWEMTRISDCRVSDAAACCACVLQRFRNSSEHEAKSASMVDLVSPTDWPWAWGSARAWLIKLETASFAFSESDLWAVSMPTSRPAKTDWRFSRVFTVRATSAKNPATLCPCSSAPARGS